MSLQYHRYLFAYRSTYNACFMDFVYSFVCHLSLMTVQGVDLQYHVMTSLGLQWKSSLFSVMARLIAGVLVMLCNRLNIRYCSNVALHLLTLQVIKKLAN